MDKVEHSVFMRAAEETPSATFWLPAHLLWSDDAEGGFCFDAEPWLDVIDILVVIGQFQWSWLRHYCAKWDIYKNKCTDWQKILVIFWFFLQHHQHVGFFGSEWKILTTIGWIANIWSL